MGSIDVKTRVYPFRLSLRQKEVGELEVTLQNRAESPRRVDVRLALPDTVALDKSGFSKSYDKTLELPAGQTKRFLFPLYTTHHADVGVYDGHLSVGEYSPDRDFVRTRYSKGVSFRITP